jgi:hypothetical protein
MTNWVVVAIGIAIIASGVVMFRAAPRVSFVYQRVAKVMRYPESLLQRFTPAFFRLAGIALAVMGLLWVVGGAFLGDKM